MYLRYKISNFEKTLYYRLCYLNHRSFFNNKYYHILMDSKNLKLFAHFKVTHIYIIKHLLYLGRKLV